MTGKGLENLWRRFRGLPRAFQWAGYGVAFFVLWYLWDTAGQVRSGIETEAQRIERDVHTAREAPKLSAQLRSMRAQIASIGEVDLPATDTAGSDALHRTVNELLQKFPVKDGEFSHRLDRRLPPSALTEVTGGAGRVEVYKGDLRFEASVDDATKIIAALESDPDIESIKSLRMTRSGSSANRRVQVRLALEAWVCPDKEGSARR